MKTNMGLWLDQRRAVLVPHGGAGDEVQEIMSDAQRHPGHVDGKHATEQHEALLTAADDVNERKHTAQLHRYYAEIIACLHDARAVLIMGPGEAKGHLRTQLEEARPNDCIVVVETADKMTNRQIMARVHEHFQQQSPVIAL